jgi:hypothetical protein
MLRKQNFVSEEDDKERIEPSVDDQVELTTFKKQLENARSLIEVLTKEIHVLQDSMTSILDDSDRDLAGAASSLLYRQINELRKVLSHEVSANTVIRNLISKIPGRCSEVRGGYQAKTEHASRRV